MKKALFSLFTVLVSLTAISQDKFDFYLWPYNDKTNKIEFTESVHIPNAFGDSLFSNATRFLTETFNSENDTLLSADTSTNIIIYKSSLHIPVKELGNRGIGYISFKFYIKCRNNQFNYSLTNFEHLSSTADGISGGSLELEMAIAGGRAFPRRYWNDYKARCYFAIQTTIDRLKEAMNNKG